jgi:hypothetical protein
MAKLELLPKKPPADSSSECPTRSYNDASRDFDNDEPDPDESLLKRWLELAEAVLRKSDSDSTPLDSDATLLDEGNGKPRRPN